jgi:hypothetical protein
MARRGTIGKGIEGFAEDLGRLLGTAQAKAQGWIGQRHTIAKQLQQIRDTASGLLAELTGTHQPAAGRRRGRPAKSAAAAVLAALSGQSAASGASGSGSPKRRRRLSAKARKAISEAQKRRWAAVRAAKK